MHAKADYVLRQRQTRAHTCHCPGCERQVRPSLFSCREHWFELPKAIRDRIWDAYRPGQEKDMAPSRAYVEAARAAQEWWNSAHASKQQPQPRPKQESLAL